MSDRLTLAHALEQGGIAREPAEAIATEIYDAIHSNVATKSDLRELEQRLDHKIDTMVNRLVAAIVVAITVLFGALHLWPPK